MPIRNQSWFNLNEERPYPVDDSATLADDAGKQMPTHILVDLSLSFPRSAGQYVYVSAVAVGPGQVSLVFLAVEDIGSTTPVPIAVVSLPRPVDRFRQYPLESMYPGVGGWVVLGGGVDEAIPYYGKFSLATQSLISPRAARWYPDLPVTSVGKFYGEKLTGLVSLVGGSDIEIVKECREIPGQPVEIYDPSYCGTDELGTKVREVIVFRLKDKLGGKERNVFDAYRGRCGNRPESRTCDDPQPIEFIGPVPPDCCGNIFIDLTGCAYISGVMEIATYNEADSLSEINGSCGVIVDCGLDLPDACKKKGDLPDSDGNLPSHDDLCVSISEVSESIPDDPPPDFDMSYNLDSASASVAEDPTLPLTQTFNTFGDFALRTGDWGIAPGDLFTAQSGAMRNVATYEPTPAILGSYYRRAETRVDLLQGPQGTLHNAAILVNYRETYAGSGKFEYYVVEIDWDGHYRGFKLFRVGRFNGDKWNSLFDVPINALALGDTYDLSVEISPHANASHAWFVARLQGVTNPGIDVTIGPLAIASFAPDDGYFGLGTNRALAKFHYFTLKNL